MTPAYEDGKGKMRSAAASNLRNLTKSAAGRVITMCTGNDNTGMYAARIHFRRRRYQLPFS
jgi:hypothetical protein